MSPIARAVHLLLVAVLVLSGGPLAPARAMTTGGGQGAAHAPSSGDQGPSRLAPSRAGTGTATRVLAKLKPGVARSSAVAAARGAGVRFVREIPKLRWLVFEPAPGLSQGAAVSRLRSSANYDIVEPDVIARPALAPNDPLYGQQWGLRNTGAGGGTPGADIGAEVAWDRTTGAADVVVAVVDTGVQLDHPDLAANAWVNPGEIAGNSIDDDGNGYVDDINGWNFFDRNATLWDGLDLDDHGTHVAGTIGAVGDNGEGVAGVNWNVRIMACKFLVPDGGYVSDAVEAIVYAVDNGATVINHSWTGDVYTSLLDEGVRYARQRGVLNVAAAGNFSRNIESDPEWPASIEATNMITVAATNSDDGLAIFSNYGANIVDVAAPGENVISTVPVLGAAYYVTAGAYETALLGFQLETSADQATRRAIVAATMGRLAPVTTTPVLVVDDSFAAAKGEVGGVRLATYLDALSAAGYTGVSTWNTETQGTPSAAAMSGKAVVWFTGRANGMPDPEGSLDAADQLAIGAYLTGGGRLLLSSGEAAADLDYFGSSGAWLRGYFHVGCAYFESLTLDAAGVPGSVLDGLVISVPEEEAFYDGWPAGSDALYPLDASAEPLMNWHAYAAYHGTSMAAPHVAGAIALLSAAYPDEPMEDLRARLESTVDTTSALASKVRTGGRIDVGSAMYEYAAPPRIVSPQQGTVLPRGRTSAISFLPRSGVAPGTTYEAQFGTPDERASNVGFEVGSLAGWTAAGSPAFRITSVPSEVFAGGYGARSGAIGHNGSSSIYTSVNVPGGGAWLRFRYWLDSEDGYDIARLTVDGLTVWEGLGDASWEGVQVWLRSGTHTLRWYYIKDGSLSEGRDGFGIDEVSVARHSWSSIGTAPAGGTSITFTAPDIATRSAAVRVRGVASGRPGAWESAEGVVVAADAVAPAAPTAVFATADSDGGTTVSWVNPTDADFLATRVVRGIGTTPATPSGGTTVYEGAGTSTGDGRFVHGADVRYAAFARDEAGNWSVAATAQVTAVDTVAPPAASDMAVARSGADGLLSWTKPVSADLAGVRVMRRFGAAPSGPADPSATLVYSGTGEATTDTGVFANVEGTFHYTAYAFDASGNHAGGSSTSITVDPVAPVGGFVIDGGAAYTTTSTVTLDSSVTGASEMRFDLGGGWGAWQPYAASIEAVLEGAEGTRTVFAQYRDAAANVLSLSDSIFMDTVAPAAPAAPTVLGSGRTWVRIAWGESPEPDVAGYTLWHKVGPGAWHAAATFAPDDELAYRDDVGARGVSVSYRVTATDAGGLESDPGDEAAAVTGAIMKRLEGADRYKTAIAASVAAFSSADRVVLATGESFADALGASSLAGAYGGPVLLTRRTALPAGLLTELGRLGTTAVTIVGGAGAVDASVQTALQGAGYAVDRIAGPDRYATAAAIASRTLAVRAGSPTPGAVFVVRGDDFADALAVAPVAYSARTPILLVKRTGVPASTAGALVSGGYTAAVVVGGTGVVPDSVKTSLGLPATRVWGANRFATSAAFADWARIEGLADYTLTGIATGMAFPDALGGGAAVGAGDGLLLLTEPTRLSQPLLAPLTARAADEIERVWIMGGTGAVSSAVRNSVTQLLQ